MKRRSKKKGRIGKVLFLLILIGLGVLIFSLFRKEIFDALKPPIEKKDVTLYFSDSEGEYLVGEKRKIMKRDEVREEAKQIINELIKGPKGKLIPTIPARTKLLSLQIGGEGVAKVNFDKTLSKEHPGGSSAEMMTLYSIVNSLTLNFPQIKRVQILIEGGPTETIAGHLSLRQPIPPKPDLIKRQ